MSNRVQKSVSNSRRTTRSSTARRIDLVESFEEFGFEVMPCSFCFSKDLRCEMMDTVSRCKECVSRGRSCDGSGVSLSSLENIRREHQRSEREELFAEERLLELQRRHLDAQRRHQEEMNEAIARLVRLRKQKSLARTKGVDMTRRELQSLEELEAEEEQERQAEERERRVTQAPAAGSSETPADPEMVTDNDWPLHGFNWDAIPADPSGVAGEIFSEGAGRSSSA